MAVWNSTTLSNLKSIKDFISEHYQREREINELILNKISSNKVGNYYSESTLNISPIKLNSKWKIFDLSNTLSGFLEGGLNPEIDEVASNKKVGQFNDFIISRLRYYLKEMAIVPNINSNIGLSTEYLVFRNKGVLANEILLPFSLSKYVQSILKWAQTGNEHPRFTSTTFKEIPFPDILIENQEYFQFTIQNAIKLRQQAQALYKQATDLLEQELGLDNITFDRKKNYTASFSEVISTRLDAEFFNPELKKYYDHLRLSQCGLIPITSLAKVIKFSNPDYAEEGVPIITQKHLSDISPEKYGDFPIASVEWVKKYPAALIRENDLLFYSVGAYLGKTNIWLNEDEAVHASFITMLRCENSFDSGYLMLLLNSKFGILQSKVFQSGSSQPYIYPKDIKQFLVPNVSEELKMKLYSLIRESFIAKKESKRLLEEAKTRVEQLIEEAANKN